MCGRWAGVGAERLQKCEWCGLLFNFFIKQDREVCIVSHCTTYIQHTYIHTRMFEGRYVGAKLMLESCCGGSTN